MVINMTQKDIEYEVLKKENQFMKENINNLRKVIDEKDKEINTIRNSKGFRYMEKVRKILWWRR